MDNKIPLSIQVLTNLNCNLACDYCYEHKRRGENNAEDIKAFINSRYDKHRGDSEVILELIGGESLLCPALLDEICSFAAGYIKQPLTISLSTNGTLITKDKNAQDFLLKWKPYLGFSIDGTREIHDASRKDSSGKGSYDDAVAGLKWARQHICERKLGVKATYCHKTIHRWAEGVIHLIELGFKEISANVVFEEVWTLDDGIIILDRMKQVVDYLFENGLQDKVNIFQLNPQGLDMRGYGRGFSKKTQNHCGTCTYMQCIGYDGLIYGCNRFCTMSDPISIGYLSDLGDIIIDRPSFYEEIARQYELWPQECRECEYGGQCPSCSAIPYEYGNPGEFFKSKPQCGFTHAIVAARLYFKLRLGINEVSRH